MKNKIKIIINLCLLVLAGILFQDCGGDDSSETNRVRGILTSGTWKMEKVMVSGVNANDLFADFTLTFTSTGYTATNGEPVWPSSGTWIFADSGAQTITRDDDIVINLEDVTETTLTFSLNWTETTLGGGRAKSIEGVHVFEMSKE